MNKKQTIITWISGIVVVLILICLIVAALSYNPLACAKLNVDSKEYLDCRVYQLAPLFFIRDYLKKLVFVLAISGLSIYLLRSKKKNI